MRNGVWRDRRGASVLKQPRRDQRPDRKKRLLRLLELLDCCCGRAGMIDRMLLSRHYSPLLTAVGAALRLADGTQVGCKRAVDTPTTVPKQEHRALSGPCSQPVIACFQLPYHVSSVWAYHAFKLGVQGMRCSQLPAQLPTGSRLAEDSNRDVFDKSPVFKHQCWDAPL